MIKNFKKFVKKKVIAAKEINGSEKFLKHLKKWKKNVLLTQAHLKQNLDLY